MATLIASEFLINDTTDFIETVPQVAVDGPGNFVVVWSAINLSAPLEQGIFYRRFTATADDIDDEDIAVATTTVGDRLSDPTVAMTDDGRFVVVWEDDGDVGEGTELGISAQLYEADGDPDGSAFNITSDLTSSNFSPDVAINRTTGDFVVTWLELDEDGDRSILAQRFDSDGEELDDEALIVEEVDVDEVAEGESIADPAIATDASGNFIITWVQNLNDDDDIGLDIYARLYDSSSNPLTPAFVVNSEQEQAQFNPDIAADDEGNFTIVWESTAIDDAGTDRNPGIFARRFNNSGSALAAEFVVTAPDIDERIEAGPAIGIDSIGNTLITWTSFELDGNTGFDIFAQQYDQNGTAVDSAFQVNVDEQEDGSQVNSAVSVASNGDAVVIFQGDLQNDTEGFDQDIFGQQIDLDNGTSPTNPPPDDGGDDGDGGSDEPVTILVGTGDADNLRGDAEDNQIVGLGGNDTLEGRGGADIIQGGGGADQISGNGDNDQLFGDRGADEISGNNGDDTIQGGGGNDSLSGGGGDDQIFGGNGADDIKGNGGSDQIEGEAGRDTIRGNGGNDFIRAGNGGDRLIGGGGDDRLNGGAGNDVLIGNAGVNILNGGGGRNELIGRSNGNDTFVLLENNGFAVVRNFIQGQDLLGFASLNLAFNADYEYNGLGTLVTVNGQQIAFIQNIDFSVNVTQRGVLTAVTPEEISAIPDITTS